MNLKNIRSKASKCALISFIKGTTDGLRVGEIPASRIIIIAGSRSEWQEFAALEEARRGGIFVFAGVDTEAEVSLDETESVYIGRNDGALRGVVDDHGIAKQFWTRFSFITTNDDSLSSEHLLYLESSLIHLVRNNSIVELYRTKKSKASLPEKPELSLSDEIMVSDYLEDIALLLTTLGNHVFSSTSVSRNPDGVVFRYKGDGFDSYGIDEGDGFTLLKGSKIRKTLHASAPSPAVYRRQKLLRTKALVREDKETISLTLEENVAFISPTEAAVFVSGLSVNGLDSWRSLDKSLSLRDHRRRMTEPPANYHPESRWSIISE